jgi:hypothetical protein
MHNTKFEAANIRNIIIVKDYLLDLLDPDIGRELVFNFSYNFLELNISIAE